MAFGTHVERGREVYPKGALSGRGKCDAMKGRAGMLRAAAPLRCHLQSHSCRLPFPHNADRHKAVVG